VDLGQGIVVDLARRPLIVGSGIAGLYVALRCHELGLKPTLVTKARLEESNTRYAQGGIAAAIGSDDSIDLHFADTVRAGAGLVDRPAARLLAHDAPERIADLVRLGVPFDTVHGEIALGQEAAHSRRRILHAGGDATGLSIEETLKRRVLELGIEARERTVLRELRLSATRRVVATLSDPDGRGVDRLDARPVILATGGAGSLYRQSSNPSIATGEGVAIAFRAGALVADMEFIQFHPTAFYRRGAPRYLISEALRGEGASLVNADGERFLVSEHRDAELAPRDIVSRAIDREIQRSGHPCVYLDATATPRDRLFARFPSICHFLAAYDIDPSRDRIPVAPVAHYMIGGVRTDLDGRTTLPSVYACGEVASTGVHGANRLGSNSLIEGLVFGERVARTLAKPRAGKPLRTRRTLAIDWPVTPAGPQEEGTFEEVQQLLWERVGIIREAVGLESALREFGRIGASAERRTEAFPSHLTHAALTAYLIARAALARTESRGAHYRSDHPDPRPEWQLHLGLQRRTK
jgi:L-aspartate oxidase